MSSTKFIARNGLAVGTTPVDIVDSTGTILVNAPTSTKLLTARTISLSGDVAGSVSFDGTGNVDIAATIQANSVALGTDTTGNYMVNVAAGTGVSVSHTQGEGSTATVSIGQPVGTTDNVTFNNVTVNGTLTSDDITSTNISVAGNATITGNLTVSGTTTTVNSTTIALADANLELARNATTAAQANGAGITVTGPTTPATITYSSSDDRWNLNKNLNVTTVYGALSGNASTASTWQTARTLSYTGDATGSMSVNGGSDVSAALTLANSGVTAGTYTKVTVDAKGRVTTGTTLSSGDIPSLSATYLPLAGGTLTGKTTFPSAVDSRPQFPGGILGLDTGDGNFDIWGISRDYYPSHVTAASAWGIRWDGDSNQVRFIGGGTNRLVIDLDGGSTGALTWEGNSIWHAGNLTNLNQLTNGPGYLTGTKVDSIAATSPIVTSAATGAVTLSHANSGVTAGTYNNVTVNALGHVTSGSNTSYLTSYTETDTLASVTGRGASTSTTVSLNGGAALGDGWLFFNDTNRDPGSATYYPNVQTRAVRFMFANASSANGGGNYAGVMQFNPWTGTTASTGDASYQLSFGSTAANNGGVPKLSIRKGIDTTWNSWYAFPLYGVNSYSSTLYATAYYDADNTGYYADPNSRSVFSTLNIGSSTTIVSAALSVYAGGASGVGWGTGINLGDSSNYTSFIQDGGVSRWRNYGTGGWDWYSSGGSRRYWGDDSGNAYAGTSSRAPIFYDSDNTGYYGDFASVSSLNTLLMAGPIRRGAHAAGFLEGSYNNIGGNDAKSNPIYTIGSSYNPTDTSLSNMYGVGYSNTSFFGSDKGGGWGFYVASAGNIRGVFGAEGGNMNTWINGYGYSNSSWRAPVFYDSDNTGYYGDFASTSQLNYAVIQNTIDASGTRFTSPQGGAYTSSSGTVTGAFKIRMPAGRNNSSTMLQFGVKVYEYSTGRTYEFRISGYNYGGGNWYNIAATQLTDGDRGAFTIRWGYDGTSDCVWIGETNTSWSYPQVFVTDVQTGYSGLSNDWGSDWSVSLVTAFDTVEQSRTASLIKTSNNANNWGFADYGTIWYDTNNTGYYLDPASTSVLNRINTVRADNWLYLDNNYGHSVVGAYSSTRYQGVFAMGDSYKLPADGSTTGSLYGIAWSHPNAGGTAANLSSHGALFLQNGGFMAAISTSIRAASDVRAPLFYDLDNTAYYCDPASTSVFNQINLNTAGTAKMLWRAAGSATPGIGAPFYWNSAQGSIVIEVSDNDTGGIVIDNEGCTVFGAGDTGGVFRVIDEDSYQSNTNVTSSTCFQVNQGAGGGGYIRGDFTATGALIAQSDIRLKYDIENITGALDKVKAIRGVTFRMKDAINDNRTVGVIAQEVELVLPEAVRENEDGIKAVAYGNMVGLLIEAIKEQQSEIDELKSLVKQLLAK